MKKVILMFVLSLNFVSFSQTKESLSPLNKKYCDKIKVVNDKFSDIVKSYSPFDVEGLNLMKVTTKDSTDIYLNIDVNGSTLNYNEKGVFILFENGEKIILPDYEIDVNVGRTKDYSGWKYSAFIKLTETDINLLLSSKITDVRLYIYDREISNKGSVAIIEYLKCLTKG